MSRDEDFPRPIQERALARQRNCCASCGTRILTIGDAGRADHKYGEGAAAHHIKPVKFGGRATLENCAVICQACHYTAHEGGNYRFGTVAGKPSDFRFYNGKR